MIKQDLKIINRLGIHARPAALIAQTAGQFECEIKMCKDGVEINAKSIMGVMMLAAEYGSTVRFILDGSDEEQAGASLKNIFEKKFNEEY